MKNGGEQLTCGFGAEVGAGGFAGDCCGASMGAGRGGGGGCVNAEVAEGRSSIDRVGTVDEGVGAGAAEARGISARAAVAVTDVTSAGAVPRFRSATMA